MEDPAVRPVRRTPAAARIAGDRATRAVAIIAVLVAVGWSHLAIARHQGLATNAFDLGYVTQTLWYTVHGQPFRFTTIEEVPFSPEGVLDPRRLRHPHSLLAFHVEPILLLVAVPFALWPDPRLLLVLQTVALAGGALGAAMLANWRTGSPAAAGVFGTAFLLSPSIAATALADFHAVALGAALLVLALPGRWSAAPGLRRGDARHLRARGRGYRRGGSRRLSVAGRPSRGRRPACPL